MNKKDKIKLEQSLREALIPKRKISDKAPPPTSIHTDPVLRRQDLTNQILERYSDDEDDKSADNTPENQVTPMVRKKKRLVIQKRVPEKIFVSSEKHVPKPYVHPMREWLDPTSLDNQRASIYETINDFSYDLTGSYLTKEDMPALKKLVELLINEVRAAAKDAAPIENLPTFALEHFKKTL